MPYFYDLNLRRDDDPTQQQISGASPNTESTGAQGPGGDKPNATGSGFQNLDSYFQNNDAKGFGEKFVGNVAGKVDQAKQNQESAGEGFKAKVSGANYTPTSEEVNTAIARPQEANAEQFQKWQSQTYQGPQALSESGDDYNRYWSGTQQAQTETKALGSEGGRFSLLDSYFGRPSYSQGEKSLDNLLVQKSGAGKQARGLQNQAAILQSQGYEGEKNLADAASQRAGQVEQSKNQVRGAIGLDAQGNVIQGENAGAIGREYGAVNETLARDQAKRKQAQDNISEALAKNSFSQQVLDTLGLKGGETIYDLNLNNYFTPGADLKKEQVMTPEQQARIQALSQLAGITDTFAANPLEKKDSDFTFAADKLRADQVTRSAEYQEAMKSSPVEVGSKSGQTQTYSMKELEDEIAAVYRDLSTGHVDQNLAQGYLAYAEPALAKAKEALAKRYQVTRTISNTGNTMPTFDQSPFISYKPKK